MTGVVVPSCDCGDGDESSGSSSRLLRPPKLPSRLAFASKPERGAGGGVGGGGGGGGGGGMVVVLETMQAEVVVGCSLCLVKGATRKSVYQQNRFHQSIFLDSLPPNLFHGSSFSPIATSFSMTHWNGCTRKTLHGSCSAPLVNKPH